MNISGENTMKLYASMKKRILSHFPLRIMAAAALFILPGAAFAAPLSQVFKADLTPLNESAGGGAKGTVTLTVNGDELTIEAEVTGLNPPGMHMIHIHGFTEGNKAATCAGPEQDKNGDGIIDLIETEPVSGTTLIPFHDQPGSLGIPSDKYPVANAEGKFTYKKTVSLKELNEGLKKTFGIDDVQLDKRVIYVHGVPDTPPLPDTVGSLPGVPAKMTLPVACGVIREVK
ncbi:MAG: CHRD domain-containing protein [Synergistaceae bacterium]|nr:CHRD domain-containing protein [Synergistaceae bacterium]